jgi:hypothetical protein
MGDLRKLSISSERKHTCSLVNFDLYDHVRPFDLDRAPKS